MLGEKHSLVHDFPNLKDVISQLTKTDYQFAEDTNRYDALDKEIRVLEVNNAPIDDDAMHQLKHHRAVLKDALYQRLKTAMQ